MQYLRPMVPYPHKKQYVSSKGQRVAQLKLILALLGTSNVFPQASKVTELNSSILVPSVPNWFVIQDDRVKKMFEDKEGAQNKGRMVKPSQVEPNTWCVLQHPKTKNQDLIPVINRTQQRRL